ncbi:hypothetical protein CP8484711_0229, partial [Chlamydia psittaci 84-8471/1]
LYCQVIRQLFSLKKK